MRKSLEIVWEDHNFPELFCSLSSPFLRSFYDHHVYGRFDSREVYWLLSETSSSAVVAAIYSSSVRFCVN